MLKIDVEGAEYVLLPCLVKVRVCYALKYGSWGLPALLYHTYTRMPLVYMYHANIIIIPMYASISTSTLQSPALDLVDQLLLERHDQWVDPEKIALLDATIKQIEARGIYVNQKWP